MLEPAFRTLAEEHVLELSVQIQEGPVAGGAGQWQSSAGGAGVVPGSWGDWYAEHLSELDPDLVILVSNSYDNEAFHGDSMKRVGGSDESLGQPPLNTTRETLATFEELGARS